MPSCRRRSRCRDLYRVNVLEGHTESVFVQLKRPTHLDDVKAVWREFGG